MFRPTTFTQRDGPSLPLGLTSVRNLAPSKGEVASIYVELNHPASAWLSNLNKSIKLTFFSKVVGTEYLDITVEIHHDGLSPTNHNYRLWASSPSVTSKQVIVRPPATAFCKGECTVPPYEPPLSLGPESISHPGDTLIEGFNTIIVSYSARDLSGSELAAGRLSYTLHKALTHTNALKLINTLIVYPTLDAVYVDAEVVNTFKTVTQHVKVTTAVTSQPCKLLDMYIRG